MRAVVDVHATAVVDSGAFEFVLQSGGLDDRGGFGQSRDDYFGVLWVLQAHQRRREVAVAQLPGDLAMVGTGGVEEQQCVPGRCGVDDDECVSRFADDAGERLELQLEHRDFLGAGRAKLFGEHRAALLVEHGALGGQHMIAVGAGRFDRVDARHPQVFRCSVERVGEVAGGVGGGQV